MAALTPFVTAYLGLVGLMLGSFINLAADRLARGESLIRPGSHCRPCGRRLNAIDLLPVAGYLIRGGRCATCRAQIGSSAPVVEALAGALMLAPIIWQGLWPGALAGILLVGILGVAVTTLAGRRNGEPLA